MVDVIFADVAQPDQARIVAINAHHFLKNQGNFVISIKVSQSVCLSVHDPTNMQVLFLYLQTLGTRRIDD